MRPSIDEEELVLEAIATLVKIKSAVFSLILQPSGLLEETFNSISHQQNQATGYRLTKREMAPLILMKIKQYPNAESIIRKIIQIAAEWKDFSIAQNEYEARATVQKARELRGITQIMEQREHKQQELDQKQELDRMEAERIRQIQRDAELLVMMFDELTKNDDAQKRGYGLQDFLTRALDVHGITVLKSFMRNQGGEQIDGAFILDSWHYLVECRWRKKLTDIRELDGLKGQIGRSGKQTMGLFISISGWSENVCSLLKQNPDKSIILMDGYDIRSALYNRTDLRAFIRAKVAKLNFDAEPFFGIREYLQANIPVITGR